MNYPKGATPLEIEAYERDLKSHEERVKREEPIRNNFSTEQDFKTAWREWDKMRFMDAPNKPGYYRANND